LAHHRLTEHARLASDDESPEDGLRKHAEQFDLLLHSVKAEVAHVLVIEHHVPQLRQVLHFTALGKRNDGLQR